VNDQHIERRLRDALTDAGEQIAPDGTRPPGLVVQTRQRRTRWPLAAVVAAAAVTLAFGVPFALLHERDLDPATSLDPPRDPVPLHQVTPPPPPRAFVDLTLSTGELVRVQAGTSATKTSPAISSVRSVTAAPDQTTFYLSRHASDAPSCASDIVRLRVRTEDPATNLEDVGSTGASGLRYSSLAISPDGTKLAAWYDTVRWNGRECATPRDPGHGLVVFDLPTGAKHTWSAPASERSAPVGVNAFGWSLDSRYLVVPTTFPRFSGPSETIDANGKSVPFESGPPAAEPMPGQFRYLDTARPDGTIASSTAAVPRQAEQLATYRSVQVLTPGSYYPPALAAFAPQGGARVLAVGTYLAKSKRALLELRLGTGSVTVLDPDYNPNVLKPSW
jgi:hypothetical protein